MMGMETLCCWTLWPYVWLLELLKSDDFQLETEERTVHWPSSCLMICSCRDSTPWSCVSRFIFL